MFPDEGDRAERQFWTGLEFRVSSEMETQHIKATVRELTRRTRAAASRTTNDSGFGAMDSFPNVTSRPGARPHNRSCLDRIYWGHASGAVEVYAHLAFLRIGPSGHMMVRPIAGVRGEWLARCRA